MTAPPEADGSILANSGLRDDCSARRALPIRDRSDDDRDDIVVGALYRRLRGDSPGRRDLRRPQRPTGSGHCRVLPARQLPAPPQTLRALAGSMASVLPGLLPCDPARTDCRPLRAPPMPRSFASAMFQRTQPFPTAPYLAPDSPP